MGQRCQRGHGVRGGFASASRNRSHEDTCATVPLAASSAMALGPAMPQKMVWVAHHRLQFRFSMSAPAEFLAVAPAVDALLRPPPSGSSTELDTGDSEAHQVLPQPHHEVEILMTRIKKSL